MKTHATHLAAAACRGVCERKSKRSWLCKDWDFKKGARHYTLFLIISFLQVGGGVTVGENKGERRWWWCGVYRVGVRREGPLSDREERPEKTSTQTPHQKTHHRHFLL